MNRYPRLAFFISVVFLVTIACGFLSPTPQAQESPNVLYTQAAATLFVQLTQQAAGELTTQQALPPSETPLPPSPTSPPTATPTETQVPTPTLTPLPTNTPPPTAIPLPCNAAKFVKDISVPDGTKFSPGASFTKTWRLQNAGSCPWSTGYALIFSSGDQMGGVDAILLPRTVDPGDTVDVSVDLVAPAAPGDYQGNWKLQDTTGNRFGVGSSATSAIWVKIKVKEVESGVVFDFAASYCSADWQSGAGDLPCPGKTSDTAGFVIHLDNPNLENRHENEPALWTNPELKKDGWISGTFPAIPIKSGDRFLADVGCLADNSKCDVLFQVSYIQKSGSVKKLGEWHEVYDGKITRIDLDLSDLAGKSVQIILTVRANGGSNQDAAFWLVPHIQR